MLTSDERKQENEIREMAEQMLHLQGSQYNPIVSRMTEAQLAEFLVDLRRNMNLRLKQKQRLPAE